MTVQWENVYIFVSSTFREIHAERDGEGKIIHLRPWATARRRAEGRIMKAEGGQGGVSGRSGWVPEPRHFRYTTIQRMQLRVLAHE